MWRFCKHDLELGAAIAQHRLMQMLLCSRRGTCPVVLHVGHCSTKRGGDYLQMFEWGLSWSARISCRALPIPASTWSERKQTQSAPTSFVTKQLHALQSPKWLESLHEQLLLQQLRQQTEGRHSFR